MIDNDEVYIRAYHILPGEDLTSEGAQLMIDGFNLVSNSEQLCL
ncbi:MAG: hypothetical protein R2769_05435 [Saprospiraceae bacterium]